MSFSFTKTGAAPDVLIAVHTDPMLPEDIKNYLVRGINALQVRYDDDNVEVNISAFGHLFNGQAGWSEVTTANINVSKIA